MKIAMIGTGYVGLMSTACISDFGHDMARVDKLPEWIEMLDRGTPPIYEPGLEAVMTPDIASGRLRFTADPAAAVESARAGFVAYERVGL